jgi:predicted glycosyl hydrolase (DUF1957 family)
MMTWPPTKFTVELQCKAIDINGKEIWEDTVYSEGNAQYSEFIHDFSLSAKRATSKAFKKLLQKLITTNQFNSIINKQNKAVLKQQELAEQQKVEAFVEKNDLKGLKDYTDKHPNAVYFIHNKELRLALTGPKGLKIGDILRLLKEGKSEVIIIALIKRVKVPYKEFTLDEIDTLTKIGLSDHIIAAMINVTTELLKDEKVRKEQQFFLAEQKKLMSQKTKVVYRNGSTQQQNDQGNPIMDQLSNELTKQGTKFILNKLFR